MKTLVLCNLFKGLVSDLPSHSRGNFATWEKDEEKNENRLIRLIWGRDPQLQTARTNVMANLNLC